MGKHDRISSRERVAKRRAAMRAQGLRPHQVWVLDTRDPAVKSEIEAECEALNASPEADDIMAFVEAVQYWPPDDPD